MLQMLNFDDPNHNPLTNSPQPDMHLNYRNIKPPQTASNFSRQNNQNQMNNPNIQNIHDYNLGNVNLPRVKSNIKRNNLNMSGENLDQEVMDMDYDDGMQPRVYYIVYKFLTF